MTVRDFPTFAPQSEAEGLSSVSYLSSTTPISALLPCNPLSYISSTETRTSEPASESLSSVCGGKRGKRAKVARACARACARRWSELESPPVRDEKPRNRASAYVKGRRTRDYRLNHAVSSKCVNSMVTRGALSASRLEPAQVVTSGHLDDPAICRKNAVSSRHPRRVRGAPERS